MATVIPNPAALRKSGDPLGVFKSSLGQGRIDRGFENLEVVLLHGPAEKDMRVTATLGAAAHAGAFGDVVTFLRDGKIEDLPVDVASIGLQQVMESDTVTFLVYGCTRAFTHEFVRTRKGAWFLQQTLRHTDMGFANQRMPLSIAASSQLDQYIWERSVKQSVSTYQALVAEDVPYEDARTVLPLSTETWIIGGMPMRTWLETFEYRACLTGDSVVHTLGGDKTMRQLHLGLAERFDVYSVDGAGKLAIGQAHRPKSMGVKPVFKVQFDTGDELRLTGDHRVMLRNGSYRRTDELVAGDSVMPFNRTYTNGYPIVYQDIEERPIAAHKFTVAKKRGIRTRPFRFGDQRQTVIHHRDFDKNNNFDDNLMVMSARDHIALHASIGGRIPTPEERASLSKRMRESNPMQIPEVAAANGMARRDVPNPAQAERMRGNRYGVGKGRSDGGKIGGTFGHAVPPNEGQFRRGQRPWNAGLSKESDPRLATMGNRINHNHKVIAVLPDGAEEVFDMHVEEHHNFAAQTVFVHNCNMFYPEMRYVFQRMKEELAKQHAWIADQAKITCERKHVCTYRGAEDTEWCPIYPGEREWRSPQYDRAMLDRFAKLKADGS